MQILFCCLDFALRSTYQYFAMIVLIQIATIKRDERSDSTAEYRGADKSLARPGRKQAWKHVRDARDFNNIETRAVINFFFMKGKEPKEIHAILTETLAYFLPVQAKDLSVSLYVVYTQ